MSFGDFKLRGVGAVNASPTNVDGEINEKEYRRHVRFLADAGVSFVQPVAATGQALATSGREYEKVLGWTLDEIGDRVMVTAYTGRDSTEETVRYTKAAADVGVHCVYIMQPYFSQPDAEGLYRHYATVAESVEIPIVLYNNPQRAGVSIPIDVMRRLVNAFPNFVGLKQADLLQFADSWSELSDDIHVMPKSEKEMLFGYALGSRAVLTFAANIVPAQLVEIHSLWEQQKFDAARAKYRSLTALFNIIHIEPVPGAIKYMLNRMGWDFGTPRLPIHELSPDSRRAVDAVLGKLQLA